MENMNVSKNQVYGIPQKFSGLFQPFAIGFKLLSNLFHHFSIGFPQLFNIFQHGFSSVFQIYFIIVNIDFRQFFLLFLQNNFKRRSIQ